FSVLISPGDTERSLQISVTPLCDRIGNTVANIQKGFMQFVAQPLFMAWHQFMQTPLTAKMLAHLVTNQENWKAIMSGVNVRKRTISGVISGDAVDDDNDSCDSDVDYEFLEEEEEEGELEHVGEERMDVVDMARGDEDVEEEPMEVKSTLPIEVPAGKTVTLVVPGKVSEEVEEEEEGGAEAADVVHNDVNLLYHYQPEPEEGGGLGPGVSGPRCLSPVSEGGEMGSNELEDLDSLHSPMLNSSINGRRFSVPAIVTVRKDLSFYLGLRRDSAGPSPSSSTGSFASSTNLCSYSACSRRQSLPTTALYFHGSSQASAGGASDLSNVSPRSLSVDALLARPKITSLSPGGLGEIGHFGGGFPNTANTYGHLANSLSRNLCSEGNSSSSTTPSQSDQAIAASGSREPVGVTPLYNQTLLMLHGGDMTRFTSNPTARRASYEPSLAEHTRQGTNCLNVNKDNDAAGSGFNGGRRLTLPMAQISTDTSSHLHKDRNHQERRYRKHQQYQEKQNLHPPRVGLAASWPSLNSKRRTTNGATTSSHNPKAIDKPQHEHNHISVDKTSTTVMDTSLSSSSQVSAVSQAAMYDSTKVMGDHSGLFHGGVQPLDVGIASPSSSASFPQAFPVPQASHLPQSQTAHEQGHVTEGQEDNTSATLAQQHRERAGQTTNPHCLSLKTCSSSSAQEDNHPPRPQ
ncbi:hypothetical protein EGW08_009053, partial [Elysia chlorotica]